VLARLALDLEGRAPRGVREGTTHFFPDRLLPLSMAVAKRWD